MDEDKATQVRMICEEIAGNIDSDRTRMLKEMLGEILGGAEGRVKVRTYDETSEMIFLDHLGAYDGLVSSLQSLGYLSKKDIEEFEERRREIYDQHRTRLSHRAIRRAFRD